MEGLRTRAQKLAAAAFALNAAPSAPFRLAFLTDPRGPDPECVARALPAGAALILRHYDDPRREGLARRLRALTAARGVLMLIGADAALAARIGADGVHWRADQLGRICADLDRSNAKTGCCARCLTARDEQRSAQCNMSAAMRPAPGLIVTAACHDARELACAAAAGADAAFLSPVFATHSHPGAEHLGVGKFRARAAAAPIPVYALGGVDEAQAGRLAGPNVAGFGAISAFAAR